MASARRKSAAIALAVIGVAGLSLASAAQLNVSSASLGAGSTVVASCDDQVAAAFGTALSGTGYTATSVNLTGVAAACNGLSYKLQLLQGATGAQTTLGAEVGGQLTVGTDGTASITVSQPAASVTGVSVVIYG